METELIWETPLSGAGGAKGAAVAGGALLTTRTVRTADSARVVCARSDDGGRTWRDRGEIVRAAAGGDLGDGCLLALDRRRLLFSFRDNRPPHFAIRVWESGDGGKTWAPHSTVAEASGARRGLWSSFLLRVGRRILCVFDDEDTPFAAGFAGHQWLTARTWDPKRRQWTDPVTVSRAHDPAHLSRDGMPSVVALPSGRLLCALETVSTDPIHASQIRLVTSDDGGRSWSWRRDERPIAFAPEKPRFAAYCPWLTRLPGGALALVFATNEDRATFDPPATPAHRLSCDIKAMVSRDDGKTWSAPEVVYVSGHRSYMPQLVALSGERLVCLLLDFAADRFVAVPGAWKNKTGAEG